MRNWSCARKHCRMMARRSSSFRSMLSRVGPREVPQTTDIAWMSCARTAARNCSTAWRADGAPVICPEGPAVVAVAHAIVATASSGRSGVSLNGVCILRNLSPR